MQLLEQLRATATSKGFVLLGLTSSDLLAHYPIYADWVHKGLHAQMGYLSSENGMRLRQSPQHLMPDCKSIVMLAYPYNPIHVVKDGSNAIVAAYAQGKDYHDLLPPLLNEIVDEIETILQHPVHARVFTDAVPLLERELAARAGLGWIGKNSCLIHPEHGSYFFLSEILLDVDLGIEIASKQIPDRCGICQRCIEACPTRCIQPNRTLDANRCISYLTIENKGAIPIDLRPAIGTHLFGCDICQQVCPWNNKIMPNYSTQMLDILLDDFIGYKIMTEEEFKQQFAHTPISRVKRRGFYRNLAVVLGNTHDVRFIHTLAALLETDEPLIRQHAAWGLGCIQSQDAKHILQEALKNEGSEIVLLEINYGIENQKAR